MVGVGLDGFTWQYLATALWSTNDDDGVPLDKNYSVTDISDEAAQKAVEDCERFQRENVISLAPFNLETAGHDFWLTRNRHGCCFWDGDYPEPEATRLSEASQAFGEAWLIAGEDGKVHFL